MGIASSRLWTYVPIVLAALMLAALLSLTSLFR